MLENNATKVENFGVKNDLSNPLKHGPSWVWWLYIAQSKPYMRFIDYENKSSSPQKPAIAFYFELQ